VTDIADTRLDEQRLELLQRKLIERGLTQSTEPVDGATPGMSAGQLRMWFL
jgi:mycobactin peptide synthetase MbtE